MPEDKAPEDKENKVNDLKQAEKQAAVKEQLAQIESTIEGKSDSKIKIFSTAYIIIFSLNFLIVAVVFGILYYVKFVYVKPVITDTSVMKKIEDKKDNITEFIEYKLDSFTVNLRKNKTNKYVNARFSLIAMDWETRDEIDRKIDKIRDAIIKILNDKYSEELISVQGKLFLKDQIAIEVNNVLVKGSIKEVYIESFVIQ